MSTVIEKGMEACPGYRLTHRLGVGGFGEVWEAAAADGSTVALKFLDCARKSGRVVVNEIRHLVSLRDLRHPHLIELRSVLASPNYMIICMERADCSLLELYRKHYQGHRTSLPALQLCNLLWQAAQALDFLAAQRLPGPGLNGIRLQHCDVKPSNLLLLGDTVKVADFGLCGPQLWHSRRKLEIGTPPFAAPEFAEGQITDRSDQYALAVTYCELRLGRLPFPMRARTVLSRTPDLTGLSERERMIVARALEVKWLNRWPTCQAFMAALREAVSSGSSLNHPTLAKLSAQAS